MSSASSQPAPATLSGSRPLATILLTGHNQADFLRQAIEGALAQTYQPLEIILSDDASSDSSYEIMRQTAAAYRGPHRLVLNRNPKNLGITQHINVLGRLARGRYLFIAGGDDVSMPERVARCMEAWHKAEDRVAMVFTNLRQVNASGQTLWPKTYVADNAQQGVFASLVSAIHGGRADLSCIERLPQSLSECVIGASMAFDRALLDEFGPLPLVSPVEDMPLTFRARLLGGVVYVDEVLVNYRRHSGNFEPDAEFVPDRGLLADKWRDLWPAFFMAYRDDLITAKKLRLVGGAKWRKLRGHILYAFYRRSAERDLHKGYIARSIGSVLQGLLHCARPAQFLTWTLKEFLPSVACGSCRRERTL